LEATLSSSTHLTLRTGGLTVAAELSICHRIVAAALTLDLLIRAGDIADPIFANLPLFTRSVATSTVSSIKLGVGANPITKFALIAGTAAVITSRTRRTLLCTISTIITICTEISADP